VLTILLVSELIVKLGEDFWL